AELDSYLDDVKAEPEVRIGAMVRGIVPCYHVEARSGVGDISLSDLHAVLAAADRRAMRDKPPHEPAILPVRETPTKTREARIELYAKRAAARVALFHPQDTPEHLQPAILSPDEALCVEVQTALAEIRESMEEED